MFDNFTTWNAYEAPGDGANQIGWPFALYVTHTGSIYMADGKNDRVIRVNGISGSGWTSFGTYGSGVGMGQFDKLLGLWVDESSGNKIYLADGTRIKRMDDMSGAGWTVYGDSGSGDGQFTRAWGITVRTHATTGFPAGIYVSDRKLDRIVYISDMTGAGWTAFGTNGTGVGQFKGPSGIAFGKDDKLYIVDTHRIVRIDDMTGAGWTTYGYPGPGTTAGQFYLPEGIALDSLNRIYVADSAHMVRMDDMTGAGWLTFGGMFDGKLLGTIVGVAVH